MFDIWRTSNYIGLVWLALTMGLLTYKRVGVILTITWIYFLVRALMIFESPWASFPGMQLQVDQTSGQAFAQLLLIPLVVFSLPKYSFKHWTKLFIIIGVVESFCVLIFGYGLMNACSFDAGLIAVLLSLLVYNEKKINWVLPFLFMGAILLSNHAATAWLVLGGMTTVWLFTSRVVTTSQKLFALIGLAGLFIAGVLVLPNMHGFDSSGRLDAYERFLDWWWSNANRWIGTGTGTFQWISIGIDEGKKEFFLQMHCDWLQVLFEGGFVGLTLTLLSYLTLLWKARNYRRMFIMLVGVGLLAVPYHPLRFFTTSLLIACLIREIVDDNN